MAEERKEPHDDAKAEHAASAGETGAHAEGAHEKKDPMEHILDRGLFGIDKNTGKLTWAKNNEEGRVEGAYSPAMLGPVKLEFTKHMGSTLLVAVILFVIAMSVARRVLSGIRENSAPKGRLANAVEAVILYVRDEIVVPVGGHHLGHYTPLFLTYFMFILIANLVGMFPDIFGLWGAATGNIAVTLGMGGSIYALIWILGMFHQGPLNYLKHLVPPGTPLPLWPLMFVLELGSPLIKSFVLCVRLFANMIAGHLIVGTVLELSAFGTGSMPAVITGIMLLLGLPLALGISMLEVLVCFIQAYVFTLLAVIFIGAAVHPEH